MIEDIRNFLPLTQNLLSSGMPTAEQMKSIADAGVKVVINLAPFEPETDLKDEGALGRVTRNEVHQHSSGMGITYKQNLEAFMKAMDEHKMTRCSFIAAPTSVPSGFIMLYRVQCLGWKLEDAWKDLHRIWNPDEYPVWKKFIEDNLSKS